MQKITIVGFCIVALFILTACDSGTLMINSPGKPGNLSYIDIKSKEFLDFDLTSIATSCNIVSNESYSNLNCTSSRPVWSLYSENTSLWSMVCCNYNTQKCSSENVTNANFICLNNFNASVMTYTAFVDGKWIAQCCDPNGGSCYFDTSINISNPSTICGGSYSRFPISVEYNDTWNNVCCVGGVTQ